MNEWTNEGKWLGIYFVDTYCVLRRKKIETAIKDASKWMKKMYGDKFKCFSYVNNRLPKNIRLGMNPEHYCGLLEVDNTHPLDDQYPCPCEIVNTGKSWEAVLYHREYKKGDNNE